MAESLYPSFALPPLVSPGLSSSDKEYKKSWQFDFEKGDFVLDAANRPIMASGHETWIAWCLKQLVTERYTKLAYGDNVGVEIESAVRHNTSPDAVQLAIERSITEALLINPATEYVRDFEFTAEGDSLFVSFLVKGKEWDSEDNLRIEL